MPSRDYFLYGTPSLDYLEWMRRQGLYTPGPMMPNAPQIPSKKASKEKKELKKAPPVAQEPRPGSVNIPFTRTPTWDEVGQQIPQEMMRGVAAPLQGVNQAIKDVTGYELLPGLTRKMAQTEMPSGWDPTYGQSLGLGLGQTLGMMLPVMGGSPTSLASVFPYWWSGSYARQRDDLDPMQAAGAALTESALEFLAPVPSPFIGGRLTGWKDFVDRGLQETGEEILQDWSNSLWRGESFNPVATAAHAGPISFALAGLGGLAPNHPREYRKGMSPDVRGTSLFVTDGVTEIHNGLARSNAPSIGSTVHPQLGSLAGQPGYAVALHPDRVKKIRGMDVSRKDVTNFYLKNLDLYRKDPGLTVGTWYNVDDNTTYMDVSAVVPDVDTAMSIARNNGEIAIWDMGNMTEIRVDYGAPQEQMSLAFGNEPAITGTAQPGNRQYLKTDKGAFAQMLKAPETSQRLLDLAEEGRGMGEGWWDASGVSTDYGADWPVFAEMWAAGNQMNSPDNGFRIASWYFSRYKQWQAAGADPATLDQFIPPEKPIPLGSRHAQGNLPGIVENMQRIALGLGMNDSEEKLTSMFANAMGRKEPVTIDRWIVRALHGPQDWATMTDAAGKKIPESIRKDQYGSAELLIQQLAEQAGMAPADFQASIWVGAMQRALKAGWKGARNTSLAGTNDQYQSLVENTAKETGLTETEVRKQAGAGDLVLRQQTPNWHEYTVPGSGKKGIESQQGGGHRVTVAPTPHGDKWVVSASGATDGIKYNSMEEAKAAAEDFIRRLPTPKDTAPRAPVAAHGKMPVRMPVTPQPGMHQAPPPPVPELTPAEKALRAAGEAAEAKLHTPGATAPRLSAEDSLYQRSEKAVGDVLDELGIATDTLSIHSGGKPKAVRPLNIGTQQVMLDAADHYGYKALMGEITPEQAADSVRGVWHMLSQPLKVGLVEYRMTEGERSSDLNYYLRTTMLSNSLPADAFVQLYKPLKDQSPKVQAAIKAAIREGVNPYFIFSQPSNKPGESVVTGVYGLEDVASDNGVFGYIDDGGQYVQGARVLFQRAPFDAMAAAALGNPDLHTAQPRAIGEKQVYGGLPYGSIEGSEYKGPAEAFPRQGPGTQPGQTYDLPLPSPQWTDFGTPNLKGVWKDRQGRIVQGLERGGVVTIAQRLPPQGIVDEKTGKRQWVGKTIKGPADVAVLAQYLLPLREEQQGVLLLDRNDRVVGYRSLTSGEQDQATVLKRGEHDYEAVVEKFVNDTPGALKAYMFHNHPVGNPYPSGMNGEGGDIPLTFGTANFMAKSGAFLQGHVVLGKNGDIAVIRPSGVSRYTIPKRQQSDAGPWAHAPWVPNDFLRVPLGPSSVVGLGRFYMDPQDTDHIMLVYGHGGLEDGAHLGNMISAVEIVPTKLLNDSFGNWVKPRKLSHGASNVVAYLPGTASYDMADRIDTLLRAGSLDGVSVDSYQGVRNAGPQSDNRPMPRPGTQLSQDTVPYGQGTEDLQTKAAQAVAGDSQELQPWAEYLAKTTEADWNLAKRGVVPHDEQQNVGIAIAARTGFNADEIKDILLKGGTPASEGMVAAAITSRVEIARAVQSGDYQTFVQHLTNAGNMMVAARAQASEFGRALGHWGWMQRQATLDQLVQASQEGTEIAKNVLAGKDQLTPEALVKGLGGPDEVEYLRAALQTAAEKGTLNLDNIANAFNAKMAGAMRQKERGTLSRLADMPLEWFRAMILTGPATHEVNLASTGLNIAMHDLLVNPIAAGINLVTKAPDQPGFADQAAGLMGITRSLSDVAALAKFGAFTEYPAQQMAQMAHANPFQQQAMAMLGEDKWRSEAQAAIPGAVGRGVRNVGFAPLSAEDSALRAIVLNYEIRAEMHKRGIEWDGQSAVPADVMSEAMDRAEQQTFNKELGAVGTWLGRLVRGSKVGSWVIPFTRTMQNIIKEGVTYLPGPNLALQETREALTTPHSRAQNEAIAKMVVGSGLAALIAMLRSDPEDPDKYLTAQAPSDWKQRNIWYLENGNLAIKTPNGQYEISRMEPLNIVLGSLIGAVDAWNAKDKDWTTRMADAATAMAKTPLNAHFLMTVGDMINAMGDVADGENPFEGKRFNSWLNRTGAAMTVPQFGYQAAQFNDPWMRQADSTSYKEQVMMRVPGLREQLPQRLNMKGEPVPEARYHDPFPAIQRRPPSPDDPFAKQLLAWDQGMGLPKNYDEMSQEQKQAYLSYRWNTLSKWMQDVAKERGKPLTLEEYQSALRSFNSRKQTAEVRNGNVEAAKEIPDMTKNMAEKLGMPQEEAPAPEAKPKAAAKPKAPPKPKMTAAQKLDAAGGSTDQSKDPLTQVLVRSKIGMTVPTWMKKLPPEERDSILADRWEMLREATGGMPEDADIKDIQNAVAKAKAKWSRKWKARRDELKEEGD